VRGDLAQVFSRIATFQAANPDLDPDPSVPLLQATLMYQHSRLYNGAGSFYRNDWEDEIPEIDEPLAAPSLMALLEGGLTDLPRAEQAERLRQARYDDAGEILEMMAGKDLPPDLFFSNANFAFDNGRYDLAAELYEKWFDAVESPHSGNVNLAAWNLFLCRRDLDKAVAMARFAYSLDKGPGVADTLAQLLYVTGAVDEAIEIEKRAAAEAEGQAAKEYAAVVTRMETGEGMIDQAEFESYPE
jgi:tetratricopeptide (TPR) repeat protein